VCGICFLHVGGTDDSLGFGSRPTLRVDARGPTFVAKEVRTWLCQADVKTLFIARGSSWENGCVESFNGKLRDELLNQELFLSLAEAR